MPSRTVGARGRADAFGACPTNRCGPRRFVRRPDGRSPRLDHPLDQGKSDRTPAGLLARGSRLDARPSQALAQWLAKRKTRPPAHLVRRSQLQGQPRNGTDRSARTAFPFKPLARHRRDPSGRPRKDGRCLPARRPAFHFSAECGRRLSASARPPHSPALARIAYSPPSTAGDDTSSATSGSRFQQARTTSRKR